MINILWKYLQTKINDEIINEFENNYKIELSEDFKKIINLYNGAMPIPNVFKSSNGQERVFNNLLSFNKVDKGNINDVIKWLENDIPKNLIPIAEDPFGNFICYNYASTKIDIVFWEHETGHIEKICNSFTELMDKFKVDSTQ